MNINTPATTNNNTATRFNTPANFSSAWTFNKGRMIPNSTITKPATKKIQANNASTEGLVLPETINGSLYLKRLEKKYLMQY